MSYPGRSHQHCKMKFEQWSKKVCGEKSAEVVVVISLELL